MIINSATLPLSLLTHCNLVRLCLHLQFESWEWKTFLFERQRGALSFQGSFLHADARLSHHIHTGHRNKTSCRRRETVAEVRSETVTLRGNQTFDSHVPNCGAPPTPFKSTVQPRSAPHQRELRLYQTFTDWENWG